MELYFVATSKKQTLQCTLLHYSYYTLNLSLQSVYAYVLIVQPNQLKYLVDYYLFYFDMSRYFVAYNKKHVSEDSKGIDLYIIGIEWQL